jgi:hypothetical protein
MGLHGTVLPSALLFRSSFYFEPTTQLLRRTMGPSKKVSAGFVGLERYLLFMAVFPLISCPSSFGAPPAMVVAAGLFYGCGCDVAGP